MRANDAVAPSSWEVYDAKYNLAVLHHRQGRYLFSGNLAIQKKISCVIQEFAGCFPNNTLPIYLHIPKQDRIT